MNKPHKWAEVIKAWADGKKIEFRLTSSLEWMPYEGGALTPAFSDVALEWRVRPPKPMYRVALLRDGDRDHTATADNDRQEAALEQSLHFVRWLTDWTEYDV